MVLLLLAALLSTVLWLSVGFNEKIYSTYIVYLHEAAAGLSPDSPVKFNGVQVGYVKAIKLNKNDPRQVEIWLSIEEGTPITDSTSATLISQGITGVTYMGLSASSSELTPLKQMPGEPFPVIPAKPSLFDQLDKILKDVSENVNKLSADAQLIFNEENSKNIRLSLTNLEQFSGMMAKNSENISVILANTTKMSKDFPRIVTELEHGVDKFNVLATDMSQAGKQFTETMVTGKAAINKLELQTLPPAIILLNKLNAIATNIEKVTNEMRLNPSVVIRGTTPPKHGPGE